NARYQAAIKRMGYTLSDAVLTGEHRAEFAPFIKQNTTVEEEQSVETHITAQTNESQK
ncbi:TPA: TIGR03761 family integrating conjugative element protein, partial [Mannheimia haemolytica]|nr:TIGR03761 family integrating conjugative element protein [Mannheimia haemolytica]HDL4353931.1 TIGR03761 family integrating conjugative element protein [Mannheimia haemolytica]